MSEIISKKYDNENNLLFIKYSNNYWEKFRYNKEKKKIYEENSTGVKIHYFYNKNGELELTKYYRDSLVYYQYSDDYWIAKKIDKKGNEEYLSDPIGMSIGRAVPTF